MAARFSIVALTLGVATLVVPPVVAKTPVVAKRVEAEAPTHPSDAGYLYGRVKTASGDTFEGQLRWGKEESFWDDVFNADKMGNEYLDYVDSRNLERMRRRNFEGWGFLFGESWSLNHLFAARFGDLKRIQRRGGEMVVVEFRDGETMDLRGGSNDIGAEITIVDPKAGLHTLRWNRIRTVEFLETPAYLDSKMGDPIYGTVKAGSHDFTGRIQWDNDECLSIDKLDGESEDGKVSVAFADIASIRKHGSGAQVTLKSGVQLHLTGTNDVNRDNRGVVVVVPRVGRVRIGWDDFDEVTFQRAPNSGRGYAEYAQVRDLNGTVRTRDGQLSGRIVFDLDESKDFEMLHGTNGDTEYLIPFRDIARIKPVGGHRADIGLRVGATIELEKSGDVTRKNQGLLVFTAENKQEYVPWQDVTEIVFH